jgi:hypothetical protein
MNIYVLIHEDQIGIDAIPYHDQEQAIQVVRDIVDQTAADRDAVDYFFDADMEDEGVVFSARFATRYNGEEERVRVVERELL